MSTNGWLSRLRSGLSRTSSRLAEDIGGCVQRPKG